MNSAPLIEGIKDEDGKTILPPSPAKLYSAKESCLTQYDKFMLFPNVTE